LQEREKKIEGNQNSYSHRLSGKKPQNAIIDDILSHRAEKHNRK